MGHGRVTDVNKAREKLCNERDGFRAKVQESKKALEKFTKARKKSEKSIFSKVDEIFTSIGADRAQRIMIESLMV